MARHDHDERTAAAPRRAVQRHDDGSTHPLLDLQQQAGNAAVAQLVEAQRHTLNPEEEAGR